MWSINVKEDAYRENKEAHNYGDDGGYGSADEASYHKGFK